MDEPGTIYTRIEFVDGFPTRELADEHTLDDECTAYVRKDIYDSRLDRDAALRKELHMRVQLADQIGGLGYDVHALLRDLLAYLSQPEGTK
jgi:hypothetical protein